MASKTVPKEMEIDISLGKSKTLNEVKQNKYITKNH